MKKATIISAVMSFSICSVSQKPYTANTLSFDNTMKRNSYSIADISWIAGKWKGEEDSTIIEEHWMQPEGNNMLGMFRMIQGNKPLLYELMIIFPENNSVTLRLKHFNGNMKGWEHKDSSGISFPLIKIDGKKAYFDGQTYHLMDNNTLVVYVAQVRKEGSVTEAIFKYKRME